MFTTLKTLCKTPSVSGREENIRKVLSELISPYSDEVRTDALGNLIALKKGRVILKGQLRCNCCRGCSLLNQRLRVDNLFTRDVLL